jgi:16S rRNA (cytidine1402-2'-O)-methyltransferase
MKAAKPGSLLLVPNALDLGAEAADLREVIPDGVIRRAAALTHWVAEDARTTRAFLKRVGAIHPLALALQAIDIRELPRPRKGAPPAAAPDRQLFKDLLKPALDGIDMGLISEAGLPAVADPGALLVAAAHELGLAVKPLSGPSSLMLALSGSGLNGQSFAFVGYVPQEAAARTARLRELETISRRHAQTQILIETPYRNEALMQALVAALAPTTRLSVGRGLTLDSETVMTRTVAQWRQQPPTGLNDVPAVFSFLAA